MEVPSSNPFPLNSTDGNDPYFHYYYFSVILVEDNFINNNDIIYVLNSINFTKKSKLSKTLNDHDIQKIRVF